MEKLLSALIIYFFYTPNIFLYIGIFVCVYTFIYPII